VPGARPLVLASRSPQRSAILTRLGIPFTVRPTDVPERESGDPAAAALANALAKARAAREEGRTRDATRVHDIGEGQDAGHGKHAGGERQAGSEEELVLGVDTVVELDGRIYGKPEDEEHARRTLRALAGATHTVVSGIALLDGEHERTKVARTRVRFRELDERMIDWYVSTGEWRGRAGGYAIQGAGAALVREVDGDYENVVGLPVAALLDLVPTLI
jgi:septum formation protein